jgi:hypothetical protein
MDRELLAPTIYLSLLLATVSWLSSFFFILLHVFFFIPTFFWKWKSRWGPDTLHSSSFFSIFFFIPSFFWKWKWRWGPRQTDKQTE